MTAELVLPHSLDAEKSVLGAILIDNDAYLAVADLLTPGHFYRKAHQQLFAALQAVIDEHKTVCDFVTLIEELTRRTWLDDVGGPAYVAALVDGLPHQSNYAHYADIVREKAALRGIIATATRAQRAAYAATRPSGEILRAIDREFLDLQSAAPSASVSMMASAHTLLADLEQRVAMKGQLWGVETGYPSINAETMGWQRGDLIVIAARPSVGKTTFALNSALAAAQRGVAVAIFSLEMRRRQLDYRMLATLSNVPSRKALAGYLGEAEYAAISAALCVYAELPITIDDRSGQTIGDIRLACRRLKSEGRLDLVMIDYVQLMPGTLARRGATRNEEITDISLRAKALAGELDVPVFLLSQLKRIGGARPTLEDLRESGSLEQDADLVCFLHRKNHKEGGVTNFIIEKARNGPTGCVNLTLDRDITTFTDGGEATAAEVEQMSAEEAQAKKVKGIIRSRARSR